MKKERKKLGFSVHPVFTIRQQQAISWADPGVEATASCVSELKQKLSVLFYIKSTKK